MSDFISKCKICGKEYDNYMRTFYIQYSNNENDRKCCCQECWHREAHKKPHMYTNHIPTFCDGGDLITRLFDTKEELFCWIVNNIKTDENDVLCCSHDGNIITVNKKIKHWWVHGFSTLEQGDLPDWRGTVIRYHGSL